MPDPQASRDPRVDPRNGDVLKTKRETRRILQDPNHAPRVVYFWEQIHPTRGYMPRYETLDEFIEWAKDAEVIHCAK